MQSLFSYVQVITPQVTKCIELEGGGTVTVLCSCSHPSTNRRPRAYTVAYRLLLLVSDALNFY